MSFSLFDKLRTFYKCVFCELGVVTEKRFLIYRARGLLNLGFYFFPTFLDRISFKKQHKTSFYLLKKAGGGFYSSAGWHGVSTVYTLYLRASRSQSLMRLYTYELNFSCLPKNPVVCAMFLLKPPLMALLYIPKVKWVKVYSNEKI